MGEAEMTRGSLIVISNRLPVTRVGNKWEASAGGLVTALRPVVSRQPTSWVGWDGGSRSLPETLPGTAATLTPVRLARTEVDDYYDGFANATVWPLFHDLVGTPVFDSSWWRAYERVNRKFAEAGLHALGSNDGSVLWVHDYHLMLVPRLMREHTDASIRFFLHIPWPAPELFARLPWREEILRGLLGADVVSFHTERYRKNFVRSCGRLLADITVRGRDIVCSDGRVVRTQANPISIDAAEFAQAARSGEVETQLSKLRAQFHGHTVLLGVDRLDYTKGIPERLLAFEQLLEHREDLQHKLTLVQIAVPSRGEVEQYQQLRDHVDQLVGRINGRFTTPGRDVPVHYFHRGVSKVDLMAYYRLADLMLVTPLKDGMNLVAKEYVIVQSAVASQQHGALMLSEFTGAATELTHAFACNPFDIEGVGQVMESTLKVPQQERSARIERMARRVRRHDVHAWAARELGL